MAGWLISPEPGFTAVSVSVSFASLQQSPPAAGQGGIVQVGPAADLSGRMPADLESVLGATPQGSESLILRHADRCGRYLRGCAAGLAVGPGAVGFAVAWACACSRAASASSAS